MAWITPKTDWTARYDGTIRIGDFLNASDYNRIKNNLQYLYDLAVTLYPFFEIENLGPDKIVGDYFYAEEMNTIEADLHVINTNTLNRNYGSVHTYSDAGYTPGYTELNRIESATLDLYDRLTNQSEGRRKLQFKLGVKEWI